MAELNDSDASLLKPNFIQSKNKYTQDAFYIFAENAPAHIDDINMLNSIENQLCKIHAKHYKPKNISPIKI